MYEITEFLNRPHRYPTAIQRINFPIYKGKPNPVHGKYYFVGSIPAACYDELNQQSKRYDTEEEAIQAALAAGAERIRRCDGSVVQIMTM